MKHGRAETLTLAQFSLRRRGQLRSTVVTVVGKVTLGGLAAF